MLTNRQFFIESIVINLYYLWTLREYSARIQVSIPKKYNDYILKSEKLAKKAEILDKRVAEYVNENLPQFVIDAEFVITPYTLQLGLLTEKLFGIDIDTSIIEKELKIKAGNANPSEADIKEMEKINDEALELAQEFIKFASDIYDKTRNHELFTFYYNSLNNYIIEETKLYESSLTRLKEKATINPSYVLNNLYFGNSGMQAIASYIRGEIDPIHKDIFEKANNFYIEYENLLTLIDQMTITPNNQKNMLINSLELTNRFKLFLEECIEKLLNKEIYFVSPPISKDNSLTAVNFVIFNLKELIKIS